LIELVIVIIILGILTVVAAPRFLDISTDAKVAVLQDVSKQMKATIKLVQYKAILSGLRPVNINPNANQSDYIVDFGFGTSEVHFSNLCPESEAEFGDDFEFFEFMNITTDNKLQTRVNNQYSLIGFDIPTSGTPTNKGCYIIYDSFAVPNCTVEVVTVDC
jgi:MSHA pilin protein MshA